MRLNETQGSLFVYGSRAQDDLKGGDIDLCFILENEAGVEMLQGKFVPFLMAIKNKW